MPSASILQLLWKDYIDPNYDLILTILILTIIILYLHLKGWVPPGYNYLGPGNTNFNLQPTNPSDRAAQKHDLHYDQLIKEGHNPYLYFNDADKEFIKATNSATDWGGKVANFIFTAKGKLAPKLAAGKKPKKPEDNNISYSHKNIKPGTKRGKPFYLFVNKARAAKKARMADDAAAVDQPDAPAAAGGDRGPAGGGGGGGSGVGHSTGDFDNRTEWIFENGYVTVICHATRQVHLNMSDSEEYRFTKLSRGPNFPTAQANWDEILNDNYEERVETPWFLCHANSWGCWFSPADWQQLTTMCSELEIQTLDQEIENIVIKTVTVTGTATDRVTQYNNDLTALLEVALDKSNILPWASDNCYIDSLSYIPWRASKLPKYEYHVDYWNTIGFTRNAQNLINGWKANTADKPETCQFITIENFISIDLLRTGDGWTGGTYHFKCKPTHLERHWQSQRHIGSVRPGTQPTADTGAIQPLTTTGYQWGDRSRDVSAATRVLPYHIGYSWPEWAISSTTGGPAVHPGACFSMQPYVAGWARPNTRMTNGASNKAIFDYNHGDLEGVNETWWNNNAQLTGQADWQQLQYWQTELKDGDGAHTTSWKPQGDAVNTFGPFVAADDQGPLYPWGAIWAKQPKTTLKPMMSAAAPFLCEGNAPGQLLVKLAPNYTDQHDSHGLETSRIVTYATFWWRGKLVFRGKLRTPRQWNTYQLPDVPTVNGVKDYKKYIPNGNGHFQIPFMPGRAVVNFTV